MPSLSHVEGISDSTRARELYKYYQPSIAVIPDRSSPTSPNLFQDNQVRHLNVTSDVNSSKISSPDTALTVFCQLTTWRVGCQRAMISLIDAETQYFIAESTKSLDLIENTTHEPGDGLWIGCSSVSKAGRLCERTIAVAPTSDNSYPYFIVDDLSKDERFNNLPFVTGAPYLRQYIGVPLITKRGIPIGSLFVVDDRPGNGFSREKHAFMGTMAKTVMRHLELVREVEEHRRGVKMSHGLSSFVEGRVELVEAKTEKSDWKGIRIAAKSRSESAYGRIKSKDSILNVEKISTSDTGPNRVIEQKETNGMKPKPSVKIKCQEENSSRETKIKTQILPSEERSPSVISPLTLERTLMPENDSEEASIQALFSRAAKLIQVAFELDGGAVFYDARTGSSETISCQKNSLTSNQPRGQSLLSIECDTSGDEAGFSTQSSSDGISKPSYVPPASNLSDWYTSSNIGGDSSYTRSSTAKSKRAEILGFSTRSHSSIHGDPVPGKNVFKPLRLNALRCLLREYPRGKLWAFDADGSVSSSELTLKTGVKQSGTQRKTFQMKTRSDAKFLSRYFPGVRQLLFVPLWDAGRTRWFSGCFTWSKEPTRILSKQNELSFLTAFGNCVMAEWARIDTEIADQKKSDFIGSISHELRSPLHGILASVEFLEEVLTGWEKQLVETIESCGRTLLDTINHILDFSKINHFESNWRRSQRSKLRVSDSMTLQQSDLPMLNLFQEIDISVVCEEVIDSVFAGHVFQNVTAQSFNQVTDSQGKMSDAHRCSSYSGNFPGSRKLDSDVVVILDIDPQNYHFTTQPGALRRLIMNLLGNSLKYTSHGYVKIRLDCSEMEDLITTGPLGAEQVVPRSMLTFTVSDTGRGIAPEFLRNKLFIPFAQENILSSGTGLGLSIVRSIVSLLEGEITIESEVGYGTQVKVSIPVLRKMPNKPIVSGEGTEPPNTGSRETDDVVSALRTRAAGQKFSLYGFDICTHDPVFSKQARAMKSSITNFLVNWYGMQVLPYGKKVDFIISDAICHAKVSSLAQESVSLHGNHPCIIVLCSQSSGLDRIYRAAGTKSKFAYITKPIGPIKLAKAIIQTLDVTPSLQTPDFESRAITDKLGCVSEDSFSDNGRKINSITKSEEVSESGENLSSSTITVISQAPCLTGSIPNSLSKNKKSDFNNFPDDKIDFRIPKDAVMLKTQDNPTPRFVKVPLPLRSTKFPSILIVDDNQINLRLLKTYFSRRAFPFIHTATNGLEAVQKFENIPNGYDIIFMDITMPVLDGFGATRQIRAYENELGVSTNKSIATELSEGSLANQRNPALIIAFTGRSSTEDQKEALNCGIDLFMTKPVPFREVGKICEDWIETQNRKDTGFDQK